ncbi:MAG TPA: trypsin-like serine protease [Anaerolineae bacterium]|nr:trypsin-like serine protease [Anaerolineae bacterium]HIP71945.1 trypsin-like serine protease [Anaerolineae bacterium]
MLNLKDATVSLMDSDSQICGSGFLVKDGYLLTCAHVVNKAGGPEQPLTMRFQGQENTVSAAVAVDGWHPQEDVAILQLEADPPAGIQPLPLGVCRECGGHAFTAFGYPEVGDYHGILAAGQIIGPVEKEDGRGMLQLASANLARGHSGGALFAENQQRVVGMIVEVYHPDASGKHRDTAFAIPTETIWRLFPALQPASSVLNPFFFPGRINNPAQFFGRQRLLREVKGSLKQGSSVSLVGKPQMGKSSFLYYLYCTRETWLPDKTVVFLDLQQVLDERDFCEELLGHLGEEGDSLRELKRALRQRDLLLILDEVERLAEDDFNPRLHDLLRALAQEPHFAMCLASQQPLTEVFPARTPGGVSPFHNIFVTKEIGPFSEENARGLLLSGLQGTPVQFTAAEIEQLLADSEGHPARLQQMAYALFNQYTR